MVHREKVSEHEGKKRVSLKTEALTRSAPKPRGNAMKEVTVYFTLLSGDKAYVDQGKKKDIFF